MGNCSFIEHWSGNWYVPCRLDGVGGFSSCSAPVDVTDVGTAAPD